MIAPWVRELIEQNSPAPPRIGDVLCHRLTGRWVKITTGQYWGSHGVSNHWRWQDVETGEEGSGYGVELLRNPPEQWTVEAFDILKQARVACTVRRMPRPGGEA